MMAVRQMETRPSPAILLVDDDDIDRLAVRRCLRKVALENSLIEARDGVEALEHLQADEGVWPALILLDINMPRMNGLEFLQALREDVALKRAPVFVLSTSDNACDMAAAYDQLIAGYLLKQDVLSDDSRLAELVSSYTNNVAWPDKPDA